MKKIKNLLFVLFTVSALMFSCSNSGFKNVKLEKEIDSVSYSMGVIIAAGINQGQGVDDLNPSFFANGIDDSFNKNEFLIPVEMVQPTLNNFFSKISQKKTPRNPQDSTSIIPEITITAGEVDTASYCLGMSLSDFYISLGMEEINADAVAKAIDDYFHQDQDIAIEQTNANAVVESYFNKLREKIAAENLTEGQAFLESNKNKAGIVSLENGMQYQILTEGNGKKPLETDKVSVHYHGTLIDGTIFDSSVERGTPAEFPVNGVIRGWVEILQLMPVGSKWKVFVPADLAYGENPRPGGPIGPNMLLIFDIELLAIVE